MLDNYTAIVGTIKEQNDEFDSIVNSALIESDTDFMVIHNLLSYLTNQPTFDKAIAEVTLNIYSDCPTTYHLEIYPDVSAMLVYSHHNYLGMVTGDYTQQNDSVNSQDEYFFDLLKPFVGTLLKAGE